MSDKIRLTTVLDVEQRGGPVEVCDHVELPSAYPGSNKSAEYGLTLEIHCSECDETYSFGVKVN